MTLRVLIIDDESSFADMLEAMLRREGYEPKAVYRAAEGLDLLAAESFELVLCDMKMPQMNGLEFLDAMTERGLNSTVITMSAFGTIDLAIEALRRGAYDYISKPFQRDEVICTPHLAASTAEAQEKVARQIMQSVVDGILEKPVQGALNLPSVDPTIFEAIQPYLLLGERIGSFVSQLSDGSLKKMTIEYQGEILEYATSPMTASVLKGAVSGLTDEPVSFVNAPIFAKDRGVQIEEKRTNTNKDYVNLITVNCETTKENTTVAGTVFGRNDARLLQIDQFEVKARLEGDVLICCNKDAPGVVGTMGTLLADNDINIADMALGRESRGGRAIMVFIVDAPVSDEVLRRIASDPLVYWAKQAKL